MLAGRKLLLADDSATIQKVIDLTFADEGVRVVAFSNGQEALDRLEEEAPDVVLADVHMPEKNGYEVCEYIKRNEKLKHIPVMLLVGSFEPFDEAEARRVGADDILTKPFQSIRRLIDRVGSLVGKPPTEPEATTAELPKTEVAPIEDQMLSTQELEITTADTRPFSAEHAAVVAEAQPASDNESVVGEETMDTGISEPRFDSADALLELDELEPRGAAVTDDFVLDLDLEDTLGGDTPAPITARTFVEPQVMEAAPAVAGFGYQPAPAPVQDAVANSFAPVEEVAYEDQVHEVTPEPISAPATVVNASAMQAASSVTPQTLTPEMIDAIARRAVELMSEKVVREIAWEVVPDLAELMIKRRLEQQESQAK